MTETTSSHIANYQIVVARDTDGLRYEVETAIHNGWQPFGSLVVDQGKDGVSYLQPMVKYAALGR